MVAAIASRSQLPLRWGPFQLDPARRVLTRRGVPGEVQPRVFDVLFLLVQRVDQAVSRTTLFEAGWPGVRVVDNALTQVIRKARVALEDDGAAPRWLVSVPRFGYRLRQRPDEPDEDTPSAPDVAGSLTRLAGRPLVDEDGFDELVDLLQRQPTATGLIGARLQSMRVRDLLARLAAPEFGLGLVGEAGRRAVAKVRGLDGPFDADTADHIGGEGTAWALYEPCVLGLVWFDARTGRYQLSPEGRLAARLT